MNPSKTPQNLEDAPINLSDLIDVLTILTIEILAHTKNTSRETDIALDSIANKLLDISRMTTNRRAALTINALAKSLVETEEGAG